MTPYPVPLHAAGLVEWDAALEREETPPCRALETQEMAVTRGSWWYVALLRARVEAYRRRSTAQLVEEFARYGVSLPGVTWPTLDERPLTAEPSTIAIPATITEDDP